MQSPVLKKIFFAVVLIFLFSSNTHSQNYHLAKADSLFQQKRYTQSLELYQAIFAQKHYSPAMLFKMAYIEEGLGNVARSLYYLNLYYLASRDESVVTKISEVATKNGLQGYEFGDAERILGQYKEHHTVITGALASLVIFFLSLMIYQRSKKIIPIGSWIALLVVVGILLVHTNIQVDNTAAIIAKPGTYVMSGPSAGASVALILDEGNRVKIYGRTDIWIKVRLNNQDYYIKEDHLLPISL